jgi:hypothetical protein
MAQDPGMTTVILMDILLQGCLCRVSSVLAKANASRFMPLWVNLSQSQTILLSRADTSRQNPGVQTEAHSGRNGEFPWLFLSPYSHLILVNC